MALMVTTLEALGTEHTGVIGCTCLAVICALSILEDVPARCSLCSGGVFCSFYRPLCITERPWLRSVRWRAVWKEEAEVVLSLGCKRLEEDLPEITIRRVCKPVVEVGGLCCEMIGELFFWRALHCVSVVGMVADGSYRSSWCKPRYATVASDGLQEHEVAVILRRVLTYLFANFPVVREVA